jgi:hypothetical protein
VAPVADSVTESGEAEEEEVEEVEASGQSSKAIAVSDAQRQDFRSALLGVFSRERVTSCEAVHLCSEINKNRAAIFTQAEIDFLLEVWIVVASDFSLSSCSNSMYFFCCDVSTPFAGNDGEEPNHGDRWHCVFDLGLVHAIVVALTLVMRLFRDHT